MAKGSFEPLEHPQRLGKMKLLARLGKSGMASVFLASVGEEPLVRLCVVKRVQLANVDAMYQKRFLDEAEAVVRMHHNNLVDVREAGESDGQFFIAMELVQGRNLGDLWEQSFELHRPLPVELAVFIVREVLRGLHYAHTQSDLSLVHRDISPWNILLDWAGAVRVADFGLTISTREQTTKLRYMAPEQARSQELDGRADVYSCAVVLWELVTGHRFRGLDVMAEQVTHNEVERASCRNQQIDPHLDSIIAQALRNDREHRYPDAYQFMTALNDWLVANAPQTTQETLATLLDALFPGDADSDRKQHHELLCMARKPIAQSIDDDMFPPMGERREALESGTVIAERYCLKRKLGKGAMGIVYLAEHTTVGRKVAIKVLTRHASANPKNAHRFREEARAATKIGHPNIVKVFDAGTLPDGRLYLVMEYLTGGSLFEELVEVGRMKLERAVQVIREITRAIVAAHAVGIIHRDLKPDNVMLAPRFDSEQFKVLDFGISASVEPLGDSETKQTGTMIGTPLYMAPEQALGNKPTPLFDIYAIGVIFYELLAGHPPISSDSLGELLRRKTTEESPLIELLRPDVPPELGVLIRACLRRNPAERPQTAQQVLDVLDAWQEESRLTPATTHSMVVRRRRRMGVGALMIGMVTLVAGVGVAFQVFEPNEKLVAFPRGLRPQIEPPHHQVAPSPTLPEPTFRPLVSAPVPPKAHLPKKVSDEVCREVLSHVESARKARQHTRVASLLNHNGSCWHGNADYLAILAAAYFQTQRYDDCIKLGKKRGGSAPKVRKEIARCMAKSGATGG